MNKILEQLKRINAKRVFIQFPEGLRLKILTISKRLEKEGFQTIICTERCYGACDVRDVEAKRLGCDVILHIGHTPFVKKTEIPVIYWEYRLDVDPIPILEKDLHKLEKYQNIGLLTSIQFVQTISKVKTYLEEKGKNVFVYKALMYPGQVLGCNLEAAKSIEDKVDCFLCITAGHFYGFGIVLQTEKPVFSLDLEKSEIYSLEQEKRKIQKIIAWNKSQLEDAERIGILVSWKKGQIKLVASEIKKKLEKLDKEVYILAMDEITPDKLEGLKLDFLINCACPRIGIDDIGRYRIPIINCSEMEKS